MIEDLLIEFDEMGFAPTTLCENPEKYAVEWKKRLVAEIDKFQKALFKQKETMQIIAKEKQQYFDELQIAQEVVRCKDCIYFQPEFILTNDGERRPYTEQEIKNGKVVSMDVGINCGSRCERFGYWEENKIPVWFDENDFCSYGKRRKAVRSDGLH